MSKASGKVTIKKYANRRLYDTESSTYITLDRLAQMVREGREFEVVDAKSGEDITRQVLTQIIVDEEARGATMLPINFLKQLIGLYGNSMQNFVPSYLEAAMDAFQRNQSAVKDAFSGNVFADLAKHNMGASDSVRIVTNNGSADLDLSKRIAEPRTLLLSRKLVNRSADMIFVVERPDYQANGEWQLKHVIQIALADRVAQRCLRGLHGRRHPILDGIYHLNGGFRPEPEHGVDAYRYAVAGDRFLRFELIGDDARVDPYDPVDKWDQPIPAGPLHCSQSAKPEQHCALILPVDAEALERRYHKQDHDRDQDSKRSVDHTSPRQDSAEIL